MVVTYCGGQMIIELAMRFKDSFAEGDEDPMDLVYTLNSPEGFEITGGQLFVENPKTNDLQRFAFRIDRDEEGKATLNILEDVKN